MSGTAQKSVETVTERYEALLRVSQTLLSTRSSEELFRVLARVLHAMVNFYVMGVGIYDEKAHEMHTTSYGEPGVPLQAPKFAPEETFSWWVYQHQQPLIIPSLDAETRFPAVAEMLKNRGVRSVCALPLTTVHRRLGGLAVGSIEADAYSREEVSFLSLVANQVALAVDDALNFDALQHAKDELRASEESLRLIIDSIPGLVCTMNAAGEFQLFNRQLLEYFGKTPEELKSWATSDVVHPDDLPRVTAAFTNSIETGHPYDIEHRCRRADGVYRWTQGRALPVRDTEGCITTWYILFTDIDKRKQAEDRLQLLLDVTNQVVSNLEFRGVLRAISASVRRVMQCDLVGVFLYDAGGNRMQTFVLDFPESKGFIREEYCSMEGSLGGFVFRTGKPWTGNASDVLQLGLKDEPAIPEGLKTGCFVPLVSRNRVLGLLGLGRREGNAFNEIDIGFLGQVANQIAIAVENALEYGEITEAKERLAEHKLYLENEIRFEHNFEEIIGNSPRLKAVIENVRIVAPSDSTVLIQGETGTGKEMIARAIHNLSSRKGQAFVKVNCAAIPLGLLESELFGHERGAFTGAIAQKVGRFELAHKGTLFLDEVGDIPLELQPKLLRVLQEQEFERLGSTRTQRVDVRLLAATNASLTQMVAEKKFRNDLYYRLNVFPIAAPPLRDRRDDIPLLVRYFANKFARRMGKQIESIPKEAMDALVHYSWPGNIRELQNLMERAALLSTGPSLRVPLAEILADSGPSAVPGDNVLEQAEREQIIRALRESNWVVGGARGAAVRLGLKRTSLAYKMQRLGISRPVQ
ncbi:MAG TPA: sigma 54-interacting transcriptional regulator [Bryobacteraceae bacterium]|jgi:formate hydrogenlyase transcriptional activator